MCDASFYIYLVLLIVLILFIVWMENTKVPCVVVLESQTKEQMAPLSVFDHPNGVSYVLQPPRKYMSHDIRGDPFRIPQMEFSWLNSEIPMYDAVPIYYGELLNN